MRLYQLRQIYDDIIIPKYKEFHIEVVPLCLGVDLAVPGGRGIYYDEEEQLWLRYYYGDRDEKRIYGYHHSDEEACDAMYEELMSPIISKQKYYTVVEPDEKDKEAMKMTPYCGDPIEKRLGLWISNGEGHIHFYYGENTILEIPDYIQNVPITYIRDLKPALISVKFPRTAVRVGEGCMHKSYVSEVRLNKGLKQIDNYAFSMCWNLKKIDLPETLETLGESAFAGSGLETVTIPPKIEILNKTFYKTKLVHVKVPGNVTRLENQAFDEIETLEDVYLEEGVEYIGESVFCTAPKLKMIYIPRSVTHIDELNFLACAEDFQIVTPQGSFAEQFAKQNGLQVVYG